MINSGQANRSVWATLLAGVACLLVCGGVVADAQMRITEYMYSGVNGEFIEFTNVGVTPIDMTGWSFDDDSAVPGTVFLTAFGVVDPGESVILTESPAALFIAAWNLGGVDVIGDNSSANLGRNDQINLFDATGTLVDRLTYGDETFPGSIRTQGASGWVCAQALGANDAYGWVLATAGDQQGSYASIGGDVGRPGVFVHYVCPEAPTGACCASGVCTVTTEAECFGVGLWQGAGTNCATTECPPPSNAQIRITEYMYTGEGAEFVEFTNLGTEPIDMTGWSFDDDSRIPGTLDLTAIGTLAPGESAIVTETTAVVFMADWHGLAGIKIIGNSTVGLGGNDEINLFDNSAALVDRLSYGPDGFPGSVTANGVSAWPYADGVGINNIYRWRLSVVGDAQNSVQSLSGDIGNPGTFVLWNAPLGACCVAGACLELGLSGCLLAHGLYLGDGIDCDTNPCPPPSNALVRITEYMYSGAGGEFIEFTNLGTTPVNMDGWSFTDSANLPGAFDLSAFGTIQAGESVVLAEEQPDDPPYSFRTDWAMPAAVKLIVIAAGELGRNDWMHVYDASGTLVDEVQYGDQDFPGSIRAQGASGWPCALGLGENNIYTWVLSTLGDTQGSYASSGGDVGSPGTFVIDYCGQLLLGDMNCDGEVSFRDINPFVLYLTNFTMWSATYTGCPPQIGDINSDGIYGEGSFGDINPFVALLAGTP
ncbi:MAG: lamin tail domain-containing protein [Phycisphaerae bacterium]|nr:lamin tail domain-containing protein [Phycisphaerae bacterium]